MERKAIIEDPFLMDQFLSYVSNSLNKEDFNYMRALYLGKSSTQQLEYSLVNKEHFLTNKSLMITTIVGNFTQEFRDNRIEDLLK